jgi:hypothetical protein
LIDMLDHRNVLSHTYDAATFERAVQAIDKRYSVAVDALHGWFMAHRMD